MKKHLMVVFMLALFIVTLAVVSANAQSPSSATVNIPFSFIADGKLLPPGEYLISPAHNNGNNSGTMIISGRHGAEFFIQRPVARIASAKRDGKLVFHKCGDEYFLASFWTLGQQNGHGLRVTRAERACIARALKVQTAKNTVPYEEVSVAIE